MYLNKKESKTNPGLFLYELSALQRLLYIEYVSTLEAENSSALSTNDDAAARKLLQMNVHICAYLVALSLSNSEEYKGREIDDVQQCVLSKFGMTSLFDIATDVRELSGMLVKANDAPDADNEINDAEPATTEKS